MSVEKFGYKQELKRTLSFWDLLVYGLIIIVPTAPFALFGFIYVDASGMVVFTYAVGAIGLIFTALSYAQMAKEFPISGSVYSYTSKGINEPLGFLAGWGMLLDYFFIPATLYLLSIAALSTILDLPIWIYLVLFILINTVLNIFGIELTTIVNKYILFLQLIVIFLFSVLGIIALIKGVNGTGFTIDPVYIPAEFDFSFILKATALAMLSFVGFDGMTTLAEESKGGIKAVGRAAVLTIVIVGLLFILQSWIGADLAKGIENLNPEVAFYQIAELIGGQWFSTLVVLTMVISLGIASSLAYQLAVSRLLYSMARDKKMPALLSKVHPKFKTPHYGVIVAGVISLLVGLIFLKRIDMISDVVAFGALTGFLFVNLTVIWYYIVQKKSKDYIKHLIFPLFAMGLIILVISSMSPFTLTLGFSWLTVGIIIIFVNRKNFNKKKSESEDHKISV
ncbi:APC family permease [Oceanobacillus sp. CAU 1775]